MTRRLKRYEDAEASDKAPATDFVQRETERFKANAQDRIEAHRSAIGEATQLTARISRAVTRLDKVSINMKKERYERCSQMQVCQKRLELREARPEPERINDCLQQALTRELELLTAARAQMLKGEAGVRAHREALAELRTELSSDTGSRRLTVAYEQHTLKPSVLPTLVQKQPQDQGDTPKGAQSPQRDSARQLATRAAKLLGGVEAFCSRSLDVVQRSHQEAEMISEFVTARFLKRGEELSGQKKGIEEDLANLHKTIEKAEEELATHTKRLDPKDKEKAATIKASKSLLKELHLAREEMIEDLHCKIKAQDIDDACRRVRPLNAYDPTAGDPSPVGSGHGLSVGSQSSPTLGQSVGSDSLLVLRASLSSACRPPSPPSPGSVRSSGANAEMH